MLLYSYSATLKNVFIVKLILVYCSGTYFFALSPVNSQLKVNLSLLAYC